MQLTIEKLIFGGQGLAHANGKTYFVWGALPEEIVEVRVLKEKKHVVEAIATAIVTPSPLRREPKEDHFLSCSPWQILSHEGETKWKQTIAQETYNKIGQLGLVHAPPLVSDESAQYAYRNKMEYTFTRNTTGQISLATFERKSHQLVPMLGCALAMPPINAVAQQIVSWLNEQHVAVDDLINLVLRTNDEQQVICALFVHKPLSIRSLPDLNKNLVGFTLYQSDAQAQLFANPTILKTIGENALQGKVLDTTLQYGLLSFFQLNVPVFAKALVDISDHVTGNDDVVDFYCGVGAIALPLTHKLQHALLIDNNKEAITFAKENIATNRLTNCVVKRVAAEESVQFIEHPKVIILDPPRAGLHKDVVERLVTEKPKKVIYLSCDIATHARDIRLLKEAYDIKFLKLYNFFPKTPHIESLCVLERKN